MQNERVAQPLAVLFVNCRKAAQQRVQAKLEDCGFAVEACQASCPAELASTAIQTIDVIFAGLGEGTLDVPGLLRDFQKADQDIPVILFGKQQDEETALACLDLGAADALLGASLARLGFIVRRALEDRRKSRDLSVLRSYQGKFFETSLQPALVVDTSQTITAVNRLATSVLSCSKTDLIGQPLRSVFPAWSYRFEEHLSDADGSLQVEWLPPEVTLARKQDGKLFPVEWRVLSIPGTTDRWVVNFLDKTREFEAESARVVSEDRYQRLVEQIPAVTYRRGLSIDPHSTYISPQVEQLSGYTMEECMANPEIWMTFIHPEDRDTVMAFYVQAMQTKGDFDQEYRIVNRNGEIKWVHDQARVAVGPTEATTFWQGIVMDITERRRTEQALRESEERYRSIVEKSNIGMVVHVDGQIAYANRASLDMIGARSEEDLYGKKVMDFVHPDDQPMIWGLIQKAFTMDPATPVEQPMVVEERLIQMDGHIITVEAVAILINYYGKPGLMVMMNDITRRKRIEEAIRESEAKFRSYIDHSPMAVFVTDNTGHFVEVNPAAVAMFGYDVTGLVGQPFENLLAEEDREATLESLLPILDTGYVEGEYRIQRLDGEQIWVSLRAVRLSEDRLIGFGNDITERRKALQILKESEAHFRTLIEQAPTAIRISRHGRIVYANSYFLKLFGYDRLEELIGYSLLDQIAPSHRAEIAERVARREHGLPAAETYEAQGLRRDGTEFPFHVSVARVNLAAGPATIAFYTDITQLKLAEEAIREREHQFDQIIQQMPLPVGITDAHGTTQVVNKAFLDMFHISSTEDVVGKFNILTNPWMTQSGLMAQIRPAYEGKIVFMTRTISQKDVISPNFWPAGVERMSHEITVFPVFQEDGQISLVVTIWKDIQERLDAEAALRASEERYRTLFETMAQGVVYHSADGKAISANPAALRIMGLTMAELKELAENANGWDVIREDGTHIPPRQDPMSLALSRGTIVQGVVMGLYNRQDEKYRWILTTAVPQFRPGEDRPYLVFTTFEDITTLRETEARYRAIFESAAVGILLLNATTGHPVQTNAAFQKMLGYGAAELENMNISDFTHPEDMAREGKLYQEMLERKRMQYQIEKRMIAKGGREFWVRLNVSPVQTSGSQRLGIGVLEDITDRKNAEDLLHRQMEENLRRKQELEAIIDVSTAMREAESRKEMIDLLIDRTMGVMGAQAGGLALVNGTSLVFQTAVGQIAGWNDKSVPEDRSLFWQVIREGYPVLLTSETIASDLILRPLLDDPETEMAAGIITPLKSGETTLGLLLLGYAHPNQITDAQFRLAMAIADLAGNALHRMSIADALEEMVTDRTRDLETIYRVAAASREKTDLKGALRSTLGPILESVNSQIGVILLIDEATLRTKVLVSVGLPPRIKQYIEKAQDQNSIELWVLKHRLPLILPDLAADPRAHPMGVPNAHLPFVALPMRVGERIVGILEIARIEGKPFDLEELTLLFFIADHLGLVVENATLLHSAEQQAVLQERSRLARELHDSVTQSLYSATLFAEGSRRLIDQGDLNQASGKLSDLSQITQQALKEMRLMVYELRSPALRSEGLARAIQLRLESVELRAGVNATLDASLSGEIPEWIEEALYRIALEALNNSLKHAFAQNISIVIRDREGEVWMQVHDDGKGFNPTLQDHPGGMGMSSMRDRAERLNGSLEVHSSPGEGTKVEVKIPFAKKGNQNRVRKGENGWTK